MKRIVLVVSVIAAAALAQEFRWVWTDTIGRYVEWQGDQGSGNTVLLGPTTTVEQWQVVGLSSGGSASWTSLVDTIRAEVGCIGAGGNIYLAGRRHFWGSDDNAEIVALSSTGQERWRFLYDSPHSGDDDYFTCVADNQQGMVFAGGMVTANSYPDVGLSSIDAANGGHIDSVTLDWNGLFKLACGASGEVYGIGSSWNGTDGDWAILRWDGHSGVTDWTKTLHGGAGMNDEPHGLAVGNDGNVYVIGQVQFVMDRNWFCVHQMSAANGGANWDFTIGDSAPGAFGVDITVGDDNNIYALGEVENSSGGQDLVIAALTSGGAVRWIYYYRPGGNRWAWAKAIKVGNDGSIYAFGDCSNSSYNSDMLMVCLTSEGGLRWTYQYDGGSDDYIHPDCGFYSSDGKLYAAGTTKEGSVTKSAAISVNSLIGIQEGPVSSRPSAVTRTTLVRGVLRLDVAGTLFDSRGCKVADVSVGANDVSRLAPGAYILRTRETGSAGSRVVVVK